MSIRNINDTNYAEYYKHVDSNFFVRVFQTFKYKFILKISKYIHKDAAIIDIGCGTGKFLVNMKKLGYTNLYGMDLDDAAFRSYDTAGITFIKQSITNQCDTPIDVVFLQGVLHHIPADKLLNVADNLSKMTTHQGYLFIYDTNITSLCGTLFYRYFLRLFPKLYLESKNELSEHLNFCELFPKFVARLETNGFKLIKSSDWAFYKAFIFIKNSSSCNSAS